MLVHSGGYGGGHYYSIIRQPDQQWLRFNDGLVEQLQGDQEAIYDQFGK